MGWGFGVDEGAGGDGWGFGPWTGDGLVAGLVGCGVALPGLADGVPFPFLPAFASAWALAFAFAFAFALASARVDRSADRCTTPSPSAALASGEGIEKVPVR